MASVAAIRDLIEAFIESAREEEKLPAVIADLKAFFDFIRREDVLRKILSTTAYDESERRAIVEDIARKAGFEGLTTNFLALVVKYGKLKVLLKSEEPLMRKLRKASGIARAEVTLASEPDKEDIARIRDALRRHEGREVEIIITIDPKILGGVVAKVEDRLYDGSLRTRLGSIRGSLSQLL